MSSKTNTMFFCEFVRLVISFYIVNCVHSFEEISILYNYYESRIRSLGKNEKQDPICQVTIERWATICTEVLQCVRADGHYYEPIFTDYHAFRDPEFTSSNSSSNCQKKNVLHINGKKVSQWLMQCPGRLAIVSERLSLKDHVYHNLIWIYPEDENTLFLFTFINNDDVKLLHRYQVDWKGLELIPDELYYKSFPTSIIPYEEEILESVSLNEETSLDKENIINVVNGEQFAYLCQRFYARLPFRLHVSAIWFTSSLRPEFIKPKRQLVLTQFGKVWVYPCQLRNPKNLHVLSETFKVTAGFSKDSVILVEKWNEHHLVVEIIKNLFYDILKYLI